MCRSAFKADMDMVVEAVKRRALPPTLSRTIVQYFTTRYALQGSAQLQKPLRALPYGMVCLPWYCIGLQLIICVKLCPGELRKYEKKQADQHCTDDCSPSVGIGIMFVTTYSRGWCVVRSNEPCADAEHL